MSDSINEQRCEHGELNAHGNCGLPKCRECLPVCPGPSVVTPPAQDDQRCTCAWTAPASGQYHSVTIDAHCVVHGVPAAPSVSTDHTDEIRAASDLLYEIAAYTDDLRSGETDLDTFLDAVSDRLIPVADALERSGHG